METQRPFKVTLTVEGTVWAKNAGDAMTELCQFVRDGIGSDDTSRKHDTVISHSRALAEYVAIPERPKS